MNEISKPLITAIIPTYRRPKLLRRAIKSVLNQTYPHFQVCVYDNASGDETADVVAEFAKKDSRVKYYCHPENIGAFKNFNYGMEHVDTPFFSFLSDDDILLPEFYQTTMEGFEKYPEVIFASAASIIMNNRGDVLYSPSLYWQEGLYSPYKGLPLLLKYPRLWTGILFKKDVIEKFGFIDGEVGPPSDLDFIIRVTLSNSFVVTKSLGAIYIDISNTCHESCRFYQYRDGWNKMLLNVRESKMIEPKMKEYAIQLLKSMFSRWTLSTWYRALVQNNFEDADQSILFLRDSNISKSKIMVVICITKIAKHCSFIKYLAISIRYIQRRYRIKEFFLERELRKKYYYLLKID